MAMGMDTPRLGAGQLTAPREVSGSLEPLSPRQVWGVGGGCRGASWEGGFANHNGETAHSGTAGSEHSHEGCCPQGQPPWEGVPGLHVSAQV